VAVNLEQGDVSADPLACLRVLQQFARHPPRGNRVAHELARHGAMDRHGHGRIFKQRACRIARDHLRLVIHSVNGRNFDSPGRLNHMVGGDQYAFLATPADFGRQRPRYPASLAAKPRKVRRPHESGFMQDCVVGLATEIVISLRSEDHASEDETDNPFVLTVPWFTPPCRLCCTVALRT
jgi:hypothetical protein